jgi:hypothetical protein
LSEDFKFRVGQAHIALLKIWRFAYEVAVF